VGEGVKSCPRVKVRRRKGGTYPLSHLYGYFGLVRLCRVIDRDGILPWRRLLDQRADPSDYLTSPMTVLEDTSEGLADFVQIRWLRPQPAQGGLRVGDCRCDRLVHFVSDRGCQFSNRCHPTGVQPEQSW
jgi:hypothetical protein